MSKNVALVIPAYNEQEALPTLIQCLQKHDPGAIIVVDNGSTDDTYRVAQKAGATVVSESRMGYGAACFRGIQAVPQSCSVICFIDADMADDPSYLPKLTAPILAGEVDMTIGARVPELRRAGSMTYQQTFGNWLATRLIGWGWDYQFRDLGPFRAIGRNALHRLAMRDRRYGWTIEMQIRAVEENLRIREIPVPYQPRRYGQSKISGTLRGTLLAGYWILRTVGVLAWRRKMETKAPRDRIHDS